MSTEGGSEESGKSIIEPRGVKSDSAQEVVKKVYTGSVGRVKPLIEKTKEYIDTLRGPEESPGLNDSEAVAGNLRDDVEPEMEENLPVFYKPEASPGPLAARGGDEMRIRGKPGYPGLKDRSEAPPPDPALYSESNRAFSATNLGEEPGSLEETEPYSMAGLKLRAIAFFIDLVIVSLIAYLTIVSGFYFIADSGIDKSELSRVFVPIYVLLFFLASTYFIFLHSYAGRTIGKMVVGIKIISDEGRPVGIWASFVRWVGYYISAVFFFAGFIWSVFDSNSQAWHDKIAGTYVVTG